MRLMADPASPAAFNALKSLVIEANPDGDVAFYPGSPLQLIAALDVADAYLGCELRADDQQALAALLKDHGVSKAKAVLADGYAFAVAAPVWRGNTLVVIDPPFEQGDDYDRIVQTAAVVLARGDALSIWTPIKDLETLDLLVSRLESLQAPTLQVGEIRLRRLTDPMKMNGCAMILLNAPDISPDIRTLANWVVAHCGEPGGTARIVVA